MRSARLYKWHPEGYGMLAASLTEKFFLHVTNIVEAPEGMIEPPIGCTVLFDPAPPCRNGKFPQAVNARIVVGGGK